MYRGGPKTTDYLSRFFSLLDVSGSLFAGGGTLLEGNYWLEDDIPGSPDSGKEKPVAIPNFPAYDPSGVGILLPQPTPAAKLDKQSNSNNFHQLMVYMARMSRLSSDSLDDMKDQLQVKIDTITIRNELQTWWDNCPPSLRDQSNDWRKLVRPRKLTVSETLEEEGISSIKSCMYGCVIYLNHILDPVGHEPQSYEVQEAIGGIIDIAKETPEGYGLEMGLYFGLFMAGIAVYNNPEIEDILRRRLKADTRVSIYVGLQSEVYFD